MKQAWFVTGTDTGAGKTVLTALLARWLLGIGCEVRAVKPLCSGGREDARILQAATGNREELAAINPWHFRAGLTPMLAARAEGRPLRRAGVQTFLRRARSGSGILLIEGAGGLLSPLGEDFDARDLIRGLGLRTIVAAPNRLGAINQVLLVVDALGDASAEESPRVALMAPERPNRVSHSNLEVLRDRLGAGAVVEIPRFPCPDRPEPDARLAARLAAWFPGARRGGSAGVPACDSRRRPAAVAGRNAGTGTVP